MDDRKRKSEEKTQRIRDAFANGGKNVEVIMPPIDITNKEREEIYVAAYCRVSTLAAEQEDSYEMQQQYFQDLINKKEKWIMHGIYADKGKSATSVFHREQFLALIEDCKKGGIDLIITKSVSRFARNIIDCLTYTRMLKALPHPVGVFFEADNINTLEQNGETLLGILAGFAQRESEEKSTSIRWGFRNRFVVGLPKFTRMLGYRFDGVTPIIIEEEAEIVRHIFALFLDGLSIGDIANSLNDSSGQTHKGNKWSYSTIRYILSNERYCGNVTMQKTITVDMFKHKRAINRVEKQYSVKDYHVGIIEVEDWEEAQLLLGARARYSNNNILVELKAPIETGTILNGFQEIMLREKRHEYR